MLCGTFLDSFPSLHCSQINFMQVQEDKKIETMSTGESWEEKMKKVRNDKSNGWSD